MTAADPVVVITGVAGGIGRASAMTFSDFGWTVVGIDQKPEKPIPGVTTYLQADASSPGQIEDAIATVDTRYGRLDSLINNAAVQICKPVLEMSVDEWDLTMAVNTRAAFLFSKFAYPMLRRGPGTIVNVSSVHAVATSANIAAYAASKGALVAFTRALAIEFAADGIRVNAVLPGAVDTHMLRAGLGRGHLHSDAIDDLLGELSEKTVLKRIGDPSEIAEAIHYLAHPERSSFMTGQALIVDGGATIRLSTE